MQTKQLRSQDSIKNAENKKRANETVTDIDGNVYHTVTIGKQIWMKENLKVTHYRNGDEIPNITNNSEWGKLTSGAFCNYNNNSNYVNVYGRLYNWYAVNDRRKICPKGWHTPSFDELTVLTNYLGGKYPAGGKMKKSGTSSWSFPNDGATNSSGFSALPGGYCDNDNGIFRFIGDLGHWWCATEYSRLNAWSWQLNWNSCGIEWGSGANKACGFSVRCIRD